MSANKPLGLVAVTGRELLREELAAVALRLPGEVAPLVETLMRDHETALVDVIDEVLTALEASIPALTTIDEVIAAVIGAIRDVGRLDERILGRRADHMVDVGEWLAPLFDVVAESTVEQLAEIRDRVFVDPVNRLAASFAAHVPPNWDPAALCDVLDLIGDTGLPLVDVPGRSTVDALVATRRAGGDVFATLVAHHDDVLTQVEQVANNARGDVRYATAAAYLDDAVAALRHGSPRSALCAAAVASDVVVQGLTGSPPTRQVIDAHRVDDAPNLPLPEVRRRLVLHCATRIYERWYPNGGQPHPAGLSRHLAAHVLLDDPSRIERDALWAVLLLANLIHVGLLDETPR